jgi:hypothetical protein
VSMIIYEWAAIIACSEFNYTCMYVCMYVCSGIQRMMRTVQFWYSYFIVAIYPYIHMYGYNVEIEFNFIIFLWCMYCIAEIEFVSFTRFCSM